MPQRSPGQPTQSDQDLRYTFQQLVHLSKPKCSCRVVPGLYHIIHATVFPSLYLTGAQQELCSMMTISQVIQEHKIKWVLARADMLCITFCDS
jgi:hypothetical protein